MTGYHEAFREYDQKGSILHESYIVFGEINNSEIVTIETKTVDEKSFEEAEMIINEETLLYQYS
ncbi:hypothetical protein [Calidifontibacillus erzurumensis]|uniref:hypothetical protein n=1 Tax=Calidifontibacillus erzurumensis TaxID=2741433 RepID=UPI0035B56A3F